MRPPLSVDAAVIETAPSIETMIATAQTPVPATASRPAGYGQLHTALITAATVIVSAFVLALVLVTSVMLTRPLPASDGAAPVPQMVPQPSAGAGLDR